MSKWFTRIRSLCLISMITTGAPLLSLACFCRAFHCRVPVSEQGYLVIAIAVMTISAILWMTLEWIAQQY